MCTPCRCYTATTLVRQRWKQAVAGQWWTDRAAVPMLPAETASPSPCCCLPLPAPAASVFSGYQIDRRVFVFWGQYSVVRTARGRGTAWGMCHTACSKHQMGMCCDACTPPPPSGAAPAA